MCLHNESAGPMASPHRENSPQGVFLSTISRGVRTDYQPLHTQWTPIARWKGLRIKYRSPQGSISCRKCAPCEERQG